MTTLDAVDFRAKARANLSAYAGRHIRIFDRAGELIAAGHFKGIALATPLVNPLYPTTPAEDAPAAYYAFTDHSTSPPWHSAHTVEID
ncbi:MAG: hypothetical protein O3B27_06775 [Actinomycetota bacterium]|nr:hypothetical protein [Actinomycetota bacterium]MDA2949760.1 hypothetical protein [Actinomycetota bacterium]MDA2991242.1 hypothetical protein [Actinomycetota bacterium]